MKFTVSLSESQKTITHAQPTTGGVVTHIQESLVQLAIDHVRTNYRPNASFVVAEIEFLKEFESDLFYEFSKSEHEYLSLYRYIVDMEGNQYPLNYHVRRL